MADERTRHFRRLRRLRRSARRWSVMAGGLGGTAAVLTPYAGLGLPDAAWAGAAGSAVVLAAWRWVDLRALAARPAPPAVDPAEAAARSRARLVAAVERLPVGPGVLAEVRRLRSRLALRGTTAAESWARLDRAALTLAGMTPRLTGLAEPAVLEAAAADRSLRDLANRVASVERALRLAPVEARPRLAESHRALVGQLETGVTAYEGLVAAAAGYIAEDVRPSGEHVAASRLTEATDLLHGVAAALAELRAGKGPVRFPAR
ncbi:phage shock envelope stress response protein PspM [Micromonospora sp. CPCC 205556]|uniref:phage shock envelope stress response protein PspM n=1 Tax=Micromonospora sp. CPCC 205556 TaxID=3122398 RepID=UPI002FF07DF6